MKYFEDFEIGDTHYLGEDTITKSAIVEFAERFDPQPFHLDEEAAKETMYGGIIASGWHTGSLCMRHQATGLLLDTAILGARGVDEFRWHEPVRPGDTLTTTGEVLEKRRSESHPRRGYVDYQLTMTNQNDDVVTSLIGLLMIERRRSE